MNILRPYLPHLQNPVPVSLKKGGKKKQAADKKQLGRRVLAFQKTRIQSQSYTSKHSLP
jgi:hypothetical protein